MPILYAGGSGCKSAPLAKAMAIKPLSCVMLYPMGSVRPSQVYCAAINIVQFHRMDL